MRRGFCQDHENLPPCMLHLKLITKTTGNYSTDNAGIFLVLGYFILMNKEHTKNTNFNNYEACFHFISNEQCNNFNS